MGAAARPRVAQRQSTLADAVALALSAQPGVLDLAAQPGVPYLVHDDEPAALEPARGEVESRRSLDLGDLGCPVQHRVDGAEHRADPLG